MPTPSPLGFTGGLTLSMQTKDRKKAQQWYQDTLGLQLLYEVEEIGWSELATECERVNIGLSEVETPRVGAGPVPTFGVNDIDDARKQLEAKDVRFDGETQEIPNMVKLATFFDPDGNALMLFQELSQPE
jgi:CreA protein